MAPDAPANESQHAQTRHPDPRRIGLLLAMRRHLHAVHHVPGRLRVRATAGLLDVTRQWRGESITLDGAIRVIDGIRAIRINPAAATAVIEYDPVRVPFDAWHRLLDGSDTEALEILRRYVPGLDPQQGSTHPKSSQED